MVKLDKVKWGFIGCGEVTEKKSGPAFALIEGSEVVAVMSRDKEKAQSYAKRHNIAYFSVLNHLAYFLEIRKIASVISYETRNSCFL